MTKKEIAAALARIEQRQRRILYFLADVTDAPDTADEPPCDPETDPDCDPQDPGDPPDPPPGS